MTRPWRATAEQVAEHGEEQADRRAWEAWANVPWDEEAYYAACAVADAMCPPPTFRARVALDQVAEWIAAQHEVTAEEVQALFMPVVRELVWHETAPGWFASSKMYDACYFIRPMFHGVAGVWWTDDGIREEGWTAAESVEAAQAAAQAHWEARAMAFWREAFSPEK